MNSAYFVTEKDINSSHRAVQYRCAGRLSGGFRKRFTVENKTCIQVIQFFMYLNSRSFKKAFQTAAFIF